MSTPEIAKLAKTPIDATEEVVYQVPSATVASITQIIMCNTHSGAVTVNIAITDSAASSSAVTDRIFSGFSLAANETAMIMTNLPITNQEKIWANASVDDVVNLVISGVTTATS